MAMKALAAATVLSGGLITGSPTLAATVIVQAVYNAADPGGAFTPGDPNGTILNTPLYETVDPQNAGDDCTSAGNCTYDFTFVLAGLAPGSTTQVQVAAQLSDMPVNLGFDLFSGSPGATTYTPVSSPTFVAASGPAGSVGEVAAAMLGDGAYYVQIMPSQVQESGEVASGSLTEVIAAPEPISWALMLLGFGGLGLALRAWRPRAPAV